MSSGTRLPSFFGDSVYGAYAPQDKALPSSLGLINSLLASRLMEDISGIIMGWLFGFYTYVAGEGAH